MSKDLFSNHAAQYAAFRPSYPPDLFEFIFRHVKNFDLAWDAGTGNGQVARDLSKKFKKVFATDISQQQLDNAYQGENIFFEIAGETISFPESQFDLITVAQAIHWFDRQKFYQEVKRVAKPDAILAVWGYGLLRVNDPIDLIIHEFYTQVIGPYWDKERKLIDEHYKSIEFPFSEIEAPPFAFSFYWSIEELQGYLTTWSSVQKFIKEKQTNPVLELMMKIQPHWRAERMEVKFPLFLRMAKIR